MKIKISQKQKRQSKYAGLSPNEINDNVEKMGLPFDVVLQWFV